MDINESMAMNLEGNLDVAIEDMECADIEVLEYIGIDVIEQFIQRLKGLQAKLKAAEAEIEEESREDRYDRLIYDGARDLAAEYKRRIQPMRDKLIEMGVRDANLLDAVVDAQVSPHYQPSNYRGEMCDEGLIEALKDCLRPLHGF